MNGSFPHVYFAACRQYGDELARIKVGESRTIPEMHTRFRDIANGLGIDRDQVFPLALIRGSREHEQDIHRYFGKPSHHNGATVRTDSDNHCWSGFGEFFNVEAPIVDYIRWLRDQPWTALDVSSLNGVNAEPFEVWCPRKERVKRLPDAIIPPQNWSDLFPLPDLTEDDFYTNLEIIAAARQVMGDIDLDPASHPHANLRIQAKKFYDVRSDGLIHPWYGRVWLNPPFSKWDAFAPKVVHEIQRGEVEQICVYTGVNNIGNKQMAALKDSFEWMALGDGRWSHWGPKAYTGSPFVSVVLYHGTQEEKFRQVFSQYGHIYQLRDKCVPRVIEEVRETIELPPPMTATEWAAVQWPKRVEVKSSGSLFGDE